MRKMLLWLAICCVTFSMCKLTPMLSQPYNLANQSNWCWMAAALQCLYRLDEVRRVVEEYATQNQQKQDDISIFIKHLNDTFNSMKTINKFEPQPFFDKIFDMAQCIKEMETKYDQQLKAIEVIESYKEAKEKYDRETRELKFNDSEWFEKSNLIEAEFQKNPLVAKHFRKELKKGYLYEFGKLEKGLFQDPGDLLFFMYKLLKKISPKKIFHYKKIGLCEDYNNINKNIKPSCMVNIIDTGNACYEGMSAIPPLFNNNFELVAMIMSYTGYHHRALVKYGEKWLLFDSLKSGPIKCIQNDLKSILEEENREGYSIHTLFYQKDSLSVKLGNLKFQLTQLKQKLKELTIQLEQLKKTLSVVAH